MHNDYIQNNREYTHGYCLNAMRETFFSARTQMYGTFHCPFCGTINDKMDEDSEHEHIFHPNKKLIDALANMVIKTK